MIVEKKRPVLSKLGPAFNAVPPLEAHTTMAIALSCQVLILG